MIIRSLEHWNEVSEKLRAHGYVTFSEQNAYEGMHGYNIGLWSPEHPELIRLETFRPEVEAEMRKNPWIRT